MQLYLNGTGGREEKETLLACDVPLVVQANPRFIACSTFHTEHLTFRGIFLCSIFCAIMKQMKANEARFG